MQMMFALSDEAHAIDDTANPDTNDARSTQPSTPADRPGYKMEHFAVYLPDPTVGGIAAPGNINGYNFHPEISYYGTHDDQALDAIADMLPINNPKQGHVGESNFATRQFRGVSDQVSQYGVVISAESVAANLGVSPE